MQRIGLVANKWPRTNHEEGGYLEARGGPSSGIASQGILLLCNQLQRGLHVAVDFEHVHRSQVTNELIYSRRAPPEELKAPLIAVVSL